MRSYVHPNIDDYGRLKASTTIPSTSTPNPMNNIFFDVETLLRFFIYHLTSIVDTMLNFLMMRL
jgi:hypothetical protein